MSLLDLMRRRRTTSYENGFSGRVAGISSGPVCDTSIPGGGCLKVGVSVSDKDPAY